MLHGKQLGWIENEPGWLMRAVVGLYGLYHGAGNSSGGVRAAVETGGLLPLGLVMLCCV